MFLGSHSLNLDTKGRLAIPVEVRTTLQAMGSAGLVVTRHVGVPCLRLYPFAVWQAVLDDLQTWPRRHDDRRRLIVGSASRVEPDAAGRILVSPLLRRAIGLARSVVLVGDITRLELWDEARYFAWMDAAAAPPAQPGIDDLPDPSGALGPRPDPLPACAGEDA